MYGVSSEAGVKSGSGAGSLAFGFGFVSVVGSEAMGVGDEARASVATAGGGAGARASAVATGGGERARASAVTTGGAGAVMSAETVSTATMGSTLPMEGYCAATGTVSIGTEANRETGDPMGSKARPTAARASFTMSTFVRRLTPPVPGETTFGPISARRSVATISVSRMDGWSRSMASRAAE